MYTFKTVPREVLHDRGRVTFDVVRDDGRVVRSGMSPEFAEVDCALLNESCAKGWAPERYHTERKARMGLALASRS